MNRPSFFVQRQTKNQLVQIVIVCQNTTMTTDDRRKRKRIPLPPTASTPPKKRPTKATDELQEHNDLLKGMSSPAQLVASRHGMYTLSTVAKLVGRSPITVRRWLRYEECPKPSHTVPYNAYEMQLFNDDDVALLKEWADAMRPGPKRVTSMRTKRRRPNEPFFREAETKSRYYNTTKTLMPRKETPVEYWAKQRGMTVEEVQHSTGTNIVTVQRIVPIDTDRRIVKPNIPKQRGTPEKRVKSVTPPRRGRKKA